MQECQYLKSGYIIQSLQSANFVFKSHAGVDFIKLFCQTKSCRRTVFGKKNSPFNFTNILPKSLQLNLPNLRLKICQICAPFVKCRAQLVSYQSPKKLSKFLCQKVVRKCC